MNAEACLEVGGDAVTPFNLVRTRAGMPTLSTVTIDNILDERRMELCCEWGERYNDLIRRGKAASTLKGWDASKTYYPIPFEQSSNIPSLANEPKDE